MKALKLAAAMSAIIAMTVPAKAVTIIALETAGSFSYDGIDVNWVLNSPAIYHGGPSERFRYSFSFDWNGLEASAPFEFQSVATMPFTFDGKPADVPFLLRSINGLEPFTYLNIASLNYLDGPLLFPSFTDRFIIAGEGLSYGGSSTPQPFYVASLDFSFSQISGIPEPSTWAMMILGFGFCGAMLRRRQAWQANYSR